MQSDIFVLLKDRFEAQRDKPAVIFDDHALTYGALLDSISHWAARLDESRVLSGHVVVLRADFTPDGIAALLALLHRGAISILIAPSSFEKADEFSDIGQAQFEVDAFTGHIRSLKHAGAHALYDQVRAENDAAIVLFSSGSTGASKGTVHSASRLLEKFRTQGKDLRTLAFLLFDHIAGLDTLFYSLANTSTLVLPSKRTPESVCRLIQAYKVEVLPTAPSFLNLLMLSGAYESYDLSSLKIITYGSEMMSQGTLERCAEALPNVRLIQKYGTSETGALPTQSKSNTSTWLKLGGKGYDWRVRDGLFELKAETAMLGYLNAPSPFTDDGYFKTGDQVEVDGEYVRFLGRDSDIINVGGQKVFPAEVESLIAQLPSVAEVSVHGEPHAILGAVVVARIRPVGEVSAAELRMQVRAHLSGTVEPYKIPQKYKISNTPLTTARFKQVRKAE